MTMTGTLPTTATERAFAQIQADSDRMRKLVDATTRGFEGPSALLERLQLPTITVPSSLADSVWSAKSLADSMARRNQRALEVSDRYQESIREAQAVASRVAKVVEPILAEHRRFDRTIAELADRIRNTTVAANLSLPVPTVEFGAGPRIPNAPVVRETSKAARIVDCALQRLRDRHRRDSDVRHRVEFLVNLPNGEFLQVRKMSATDDGLIRVTGADIDGYLRERFIAPELFQYEIVTMRLPPPGAKLTVVD